MKFLALGACAASVIMGCSKLDNETIKQKFVTVNFTASQTDTKAAFVAQDGDTYPVVWTDKDQKICMSMNLATPVDGTITVNPDHKSAKFKGDFVETQAPSYTFYALTPASAVNGGSGESWSVTIPTYQTPSSLSCDEAAMLLYAKSSEFESIPTEAISMKFSHVATYCRLTLGNISAALPEEAAGAVVKTVDVEFSVPVAGSWNFKLSDGTLSAGRASNKITINAEGQNVEDLWFAMAPCDLGGQSVTVSVNTDKGTIQRSYTYGAGKVYKAGAVNKLGLDMTKNSEFVLTETVEETVYTLVRTNDDIANPVIFVNSATNPTSTVSTSGLNTTDQGFSFDGTYIRLNPGNNVRIWTISGTTVSTDGGYLGYTTSGNGSHTVAVAGIVNETDKANITTTITNGNAQMEFTYKTGNQKYVTYYYGFDNGFEASTSPTPFAIYKKTTIYTTRVIN